MVYQSGDGKGRVTRFGISLADGHGGSTSLKLGYLPYNYYDNPPEVISVFRQELDAAMPEFEVIAKKRVELCDEPGGRHCPAIGEQAVKGIVEMFRRKSSDIYSTASLITSIAST